MRCLRTRGSTHDLRRLRLAARAKRDRRRRLYGVGSSPIISTNTLNIQNGVSFNAVFAHERARTRESATALWAVAGRARTREVYAMRSGEAASRRASPIISTNLHQNLLSCGHHFRILFMSYILTVEIGAPCSESSIRHSDTDSLKMTSGGFGIPSPRIQWCACGMRNSRRTI